MGSAGIETRQQRVIIIGGGITGLLIAQGLQKASTPCTVFESEEATTTRRREWTMAVHWSLPMLEDLLPEALKARLREVYPNPWLDYMIYPNNTHRLYDGNSGEMILERGVEGRIVRFGHVLDRVMYDTENTVTAHFTNGAKETGTLIVGADGTHSAVRTRLFGAEKAMPKPLDTTFLAVTANYSDPEQARFVAAVHPVFSLMAADDGVVFYAVQEVPDPERPETWLFQLYMNWPGKRDVNSTNEERQRDMRERAAKLAEPFRSAFLWLPEDLEMKYNDLAAWIPAPWDSHGRVTLAGDAAHSMPPHRGQGLNQAIEDAHSLVEGLKKVAKLEAQQADVVQTYSDEVVLRGGQETRMSMEASKAITLGAIRSGPWFKHGMNRMPAQNDEREE